MTSFKKRTEKFWDWFQANVDSLNKEMKDKNKVFERIRRELNKVFISIPFLIGGNDGENEITLSPEGSSNLYFLSRFWKEQSPQIAGWSFFDYKRPNMDMDFAISVNAASIQIAKDDMFFHPVLDTENKRINVQIYCEEIRSVADDVKMTYTFLMLDECLGEGRTETAIGEIGIADEKTPEMLPFTELHAYIQKTFEDNEWNLFETPIELFAGYQLQPQEVKNKYRKDVYVGYTCHIDLINSNLQGKDGAIKYMRSVGAEYIFITYDNTGIPNDEKVNHRATIEDRLISLLDAHRLGYHIGGATGIYKSYIDLLVLDIGEFRKEINKASKDFGVKMKVIPF